MASSTSSLPPPSPAPLTQDAQDDGSAAAATAVPEPQDPLANIPSLRTIPAKDEDDRVEALHLVADSVAQQRQFASRAVIFHPITFGILVLILGLVYQYLYKGAFSDWALIGTTFAGIIMAVLVSIRWMSGAYIDEAERVGTWKWLDQGRGRGENSETSDIIPVGESDDLFLTLFGDEAIGTLIVRGVRNTANSQKKTRNSSALKNVPIQGLIRGWTVKNRYRRKGIGTGLLEEAVALCKERGWTGLDFADDHANSARKLPRQFNGGFASRERKAKALLEKVKKETGFSDAGDNSTVVSTPGSASGEKTSGGRRGKR